MFIVQILVCVTIKYSPFIGDNTNSCINSVFSKLFIAIRLIVVFVFIGFMSIRIVDIDTFTITIIWINWWKSKDEQFITNGNWFNAIICWFLWLGVCFSYLMQFTFVMANIIELYKNPSYVRARCETILVHIMEYIFTKDRFLSMISDESRAAETLPPKNEASHKLLNQAKKCKQSVNKKDEHIYSQECSICICAFTTKEQYLKL